MTPFFDQNLLILRAVRLICAIQPKHNINPANQREDAAMSLLLR